MLEEQVFINNQWVTYRTRGGPVQQDAFFSPTTKTPYTDDIAFGYQVGSRPEHELRDHLHEPPDARHPRGLRPRRCTPMRPTARPAIRDRSTIRTRSGSASTTSATPQNPGSNFVIATLEGGKRDYHGIDLIFRKRYSNNWQALVSYTYNRAEGNTNSDSNADFQGDVLYLDPRAPNQYARQPGLDPPHLQGRRARTTSTSASSSARPTAGTPARSPA